MAAETYRFKLGSFACAVVGDGTNVYQRDHLFANVSGEPLERALRAHGYQPEHIVLAYTCLVVNTGRNLVLVDTGAGDFAPTTGHLQEGLREIGIAAEDVDTVLITHAHPDHIGGNLDAAGKPAFPRARWWMAKSEWEFWTAAETQAQLPFFAPFVQKNLPPIGDRISLIDREGEIVPGIAALSALGHTPGHIGVAVEAGGEKLVYISDLVLTPVHLEHLDWQSIYDLDRAETVAATRQILGRAVAENWLIQAMHFPFPGLGHVAPKGDGWQWQPIEVARRA